MKRNKDIIILANGDLPTSKRAMDELSSNKFLLCCDGAVQKAESLGYSADLVIGDMDSISETLREKYKDRFIYIDDQETNDLSKALCWATENGAESVTIIGAGGGSDDHYLGNLFLILESHYNFNIKMLTNSGRFDLATNREFSSYPNQKVSLFCIDRDAKVSTRGLEYELKDYKFDNLYGATLNKSLGTSFRVSCNNLDTNILIYRGNEEVR